jgi:hypothetical protein
MCCVHVIGYYTAMKMDEQQPYTKIEAGTSNIILDKSKYLSLPRSRLVCLRLPFVVTIRKYLRLDIL